MIALAEEPQSRPSEEVQRQIMETLVRFLGDNPLELDERQRAEARAMLRRFVHDVKLGRHPVMAVALVDSERGDRTAADLVSAISREVVGVHEDSHFAPDAVHHHTMEEAHYAQLSARETPVEELERKLRSKGMKQDKAKGVANYLHLEEIEEKEHKKELPEGSALAFLQRLKQVQANIRVPGVHERHLIDKLVHTFHLDHIVSGGRDDL